MADEKVRITKTKKKRENVAVADKLMNRKFVLFEVVTKILSAYTKTVCMFYK